MKIRVLALVCAMLLLLTGCQLTPSREGTLSIDDSSVSILQVESSLSGKSFSIQTRDSIRKIVKLINALALETEEENAGAPVYSLLLSGSDGSEILSLALISRGALITGEKTYNADCQELWNAIAKEECSILSDKELLHSIFADNYWDDVSITNDKGDISIDKILDIPNQFPALFELLGRPTMLESVANEGLSLIKEYAGSANKALRERAAKLGEILSNLIPSLKNQIEDILKTSAK